MQGKEQISAEITAQLRELKEQLDFEHSIQINRMQAQIDAQMKLIAAHEREIQSIKLAVSNTTKDLDVKLNKHNNSIQVYNDQMELNNKQTKEMVISVGQQVCKSVYNKVITEINEKIVPKMENLVQYVNYNMQDGAEVVNDYRKAVYANDQLDTLTLTNGSADNRVISEHVRLFFGD